MGSIKFNDFSFGVPILIVEMTKTNLPFPDPPTRKISCEPPFLSFQIEIFEISIFHKITPKSISKGSWVLRNLADWVRGNRLRIDIPPKRISKGSWVLRDLADWVRGNRLRIDISPKRISKGSWVLRDLADWVRGNRLRIDIPLKRISKYSWVLRD